MKNIWQTITVLSLILIVVLACKEKSPENKLYENLKIVKATTLARDYTENEVNADRQYNGETFYVEGIVKDIGKSVSGSPYVLFKVFGDSKVEVQVVFNSSEKDGIAKLSKGSTIKAKATCTGVTLGNIVMTNGEIID